MSEDTKSEDTQGDIPEEPEPGIKVEDLFRAAMGDKAAQSLNLWQRMVIARQHMQYIKKTRQGTLKFATVNHDVVTVAAREALDKANVLAIPNVLMHDKTGNTTICEVEVEFVNPDAPEERYSVTMFGESNDNQDKGPGGATSYAMKYCLLKGLMGETGEEDADQRNVDTEAPQPEAPKEDPDERQELFDRLKEVMGTYDLDKDYVRKEMTHRTGGRKQTIKDIREVIASIEGSPALWRDPDKQGE